MEKEVCLYQKYGFCRYKEKCFKRHLKEECKDLNCPTKKMCNKRHPKLCKRYALEKSCIFGEKCDYLHRESEMSQDQKKMKDRIEELEQVVKGKSTEEKEMKNAIIELEKVLKAMTRKVIFLEEEVIKIKEGSKDIKNYEPFKDSSDFKNSTPVSAKQKLPDVETKSFESNKDKFKCVKCEYKCKKESTLKKHINTKHIEQECKVCMMKLGSSMELLQHIAIEHSSIEKHNKQEENNINIIGIKDLDKVKIIKRNEDMNAVDIEEKDKSFEFSESKFFAEFL